MPPISSFEVGRKLNNVSLRFSSLPIFIFKKMLRKVVWFDISAIFFVDLRMIYLQLVIAPVADNSYLLG